MSHKSRLTVTRERKSRRARFTILQTCEEKNQRRLRFGGARPERSSSPQSPRRIATAQAPGTTLPTRSMCADRGQFPPTTEREQNEAEGERKAASSKAHARNGTEVAGSHGNIVRLTRDCKGVVLLWCIGMPPPLRGRLSGTYQTCGEILTPWCCEEKLQAYFYFNSSFIETSHYLP